MSFTLRARPPLGDLAWEEMVQYKLVRANEMQMTMQISLGLASAMSWPLGELRERLSGLLQAGPSRQQLGWRWETPRGGRGVGYDAALTPVGPCDQRSSGWRSPSCRLRPHPSHSAEKPKRTAEY